MKKFIISIAIILISIASYGQAKINRAGPANTVVDQNLNAANTFIMPYFNDTTLATVGLDSCGKIFYNRGTASVWYRACIGYSSRKWIEISVNSSPTISAWLTRGNDLSTQSLPNRLGTKNGDGLNIITNDLIRMTVPVDGLVRSSSAQNKYVMIDTVGKELYYGDATGSTPTWQQTLTAGSTLTGDNSVQNSGSYIFEMFNNQRAAIRFNNSTSITSLGDVDNTVYGDKLVIDASNSLSYFDNTDHDIRVGINTTSPSAFLTIAAGTAAASTAPLKFTSGTNLTSPEAGAMEWNGTNLFITQTSGPTRKTIAYTTDIPTTLPISSLTAATASNSINNANFPQIWNWNSFTGDGINGLLIAANTTASINGGDGLFAVLVSGANSSSGITSTASNISNSHTGTSSTNIAARFSATNGSNNYAIIVPSGNGTVGVGNSTPVALLTLGTAGATLGSMSVAGNTSGVITLNPQAAAGTYNWNWPTTAGTSGYLLTSAGGGSSPMTWTDPSTLTGANTALSNLASVAINTSLLPGTDNSIDLGSTTKTWRNEYVSGAIAIGSTSTTFDVDVRKTTNGSIGFGVQNASSGTSAAAVFQLGRSYGADFYVSHYYAGDGNTVYTPLSYNIINAAGSTGGMFFNNIASATMGFLTANTTRMTILGGGNIGIGDATPASLFTVGSGDLFQVNSSGDVVKLKNVTYSWPSSNSSGVLTNNGSGTLTWATPYIAKTGTTTLTGNVAVDIDRTGAGPFKFNVQDASNRFLVIDKSANTYGFGDIDNAFDNTFMKVVGAVAYIRSTAIAGGSAGDAITLADPSTGELTVAPNLAFNFMKENTMIYAKNGRLWAEDADKNLTQISPHNDKGEWIYKSTDKNGVTTEINMIRLAELLEKVTGEKLIYRTKN